MPRMQFYLTNILCPGCGSHTYLLHDASVGMKTGDRMFCRDCECYGTVEGEDIIYRDICDKCWESGELLIDEVTGRVMSKLREWSNHAEDI